MELERCGHRGSTIDDKKCYCQLWGKWTNCLEAGRCVYESMKGKEGI